MTYRERRAARAARLSEWSEKNDARSDQALTSAREAIAGIPPGQPILVGHHSERHHRRDLERHDARMRQGLAYADKAREQAHRADTIAKQLAAAIYDDDPDALDRLRAKVAALEAQRARRAAVNKAIRKHGYTVLRLEAEQPGDPYTPPRLAPRLSTHEIAELEQLARIAPYHEPLKRGFPPYSGSNLTNQIGKIRDRIARLTQDAARATLRREDV